MWSNVAPLGGIDVFFASRAVIVDQFGLGTDVSSNLLRFFSDFFVLLSSDSFSSSSFPFSFAFIFSRNFFNSCSYAESLRAHISSGASSLLFPAGSNNDLMNALASMLYNFTESSILFNFTFFCIISKQSGFKSLA